MTVLVEQSPAARAARVIPVWLTLLAASVPMFMATLDNLVMTSALPVITADLHADVNQVQWFVNAYTLSFASMILVAAALGDRFGRRTVFMIGIAIFGIGSVLAASLTLNGCSTQITILAHLMSGTSRPLTIPDLTMWIGWE